MSAPPIAARGLVKRYGRILAVDHVDLTVEPGDVFGYLGPNGAGKTTSLRMMLGLIRPTEGSVELFGRDPIKEGIRKALDGVAGFVEAPRFYPYMSGRKNLRLLAAYDGQGASSRIDEMLDVVELRDRAGDRVGGYSHGMRQRLGIAAALLRNPRLLLLDEPTTGLDPAGMRDMRALVRRLAGEGITVLLSSHLLGEVEDLCNRVAIIRTGTIVYEGTLGRPARDGADRVPAACDRTGARADDLLGPDEASRRSASKAPSSGSRPTSRRPRRSRSLSGRRASASPRSSRRGPASRSSSSD